MLVQAIGRKDISSLAAAPIRWRLKSTGPVPIRSELIVFLSLLRIAQDFVGFVDLLKFFLGRFFVLGDIRMILARKFPERALDFVLGRGFGNAERLIIISKLHCHWLNLVPPADWRNLIESCRNSGNF